MSEVKITATLRNAHFHQFDDKRILIGECHGDRFKRFADGEVIHTSIIEHELGEDTFKTRSTSIYKVESWMQDL